MVDLERMGQSKEFWNLCIFPIAVQELLPAISVWIKLPPDEYLNITISLFLNTIFYTVNPGKGI